MSVTDAQNAVGQPTVDEQLEMVPQLLFPMSYHYRDGPYSTPNRSTNAVALTTSLAVSQSPHTPPFPLLHHPYSINTPGGSPFDDILSKTLTVPVPQHLRLGSDTRVQTASYNGIQSSTDSQANNPLGFPSLTLSDETRTEFLKMLDPEVLYTTLCNGYPNANTLEEALKSHSVYRAGCRAQDAETFFQNCSKEEYYRFFQPLHPRHPAPFCSVLRASSQPSLANISLKIDLLDLNDMIERENTVQAKFRITASWQPALPELRKLYKLNDGSSTPMGPMLFYNRLPDSQSDLQREIQSHRRSSSYLAFYGPSIKFTTTRGDDSRPDLPEEVTFPTRFFDHITAATGPMTFHATLDISVSLLTKGNVQQFPFDSKVATFHITSLSSIREIQFMPPSEEGIRNINLQAGLLSRGNHWNIQDGITIELLRRDLNSQDWKVQQNDSEGTERPPEETDRSKISIRITFSRNSSYWLWKVMFPMDIITFVSIAVFLLIPKVDGGPTPDQRIAMTTFLVTVLVAQAAFTMAVQPMVPKVSYMTILDLHNNFCFLITAVQAVLLAGLPDHAWGIFSHAAIRYPIFGSAVLLLVLEQICLVYLGPYLIGGLTSSLLSGVQLHDSVTVRKDTVDTLVDVEKTGKIYDKA